MRSFVAYKKDELLNIAKKHNIKTNSHMTKSEIVLLLKDKLDIVASKNTMGSKKSHLASSEAQVPAKKTHNVVPTDTIIPEYDKKITVLPQSGSQFLMIWNADNKLDLETKAWKITNQSNLDVLLPAYSRSLFLDVSQLSDAKISIFRVLHNDSTIFYNEYIKTPTLSPYTDISSLSKKELAKLKMSHFDSYSRNNFSSDNHFQQ